jgi:hypothetical protein
MKHDELYRLINFCKTVQKEGTDPFDLNVKKFLTILKHYLKKWKSLDDLLLDAEAVSELAKIIELQGKWIRDRSSSFYIDPVLMELKIKMLDPEQLADAFFKSWHPIIALDRMTPQRLEEGLAYWNALLPLSERKEDFPLLTIPETATFDLEDLIDMHIMSESEFNDSIKEVFRDLEERGRVEYHEFIYDDTFKGSVTKAYLTSYLVNEGRAEFDIDPLEETVFIAPSTTEANAGDVRSIPISLSYEDWIQWKQKKKQG